MQVNFTIMDFLAQVKMINVLLFCSPTRETIHVNACLSYNLFQFKQGCCQINATSMQIANFKDLETSENFRILKGLYFLSADEFL